MTASAVRHVTCLGCGCGCDDLTVHVRAGRIERLEPPCPLAQRWFGDGTVPDRVHAGGKPAPVDAAIAAAADLLVAARGRALVYAGLELSSQAQRVAVALADVLRATIDGPTSGPAATGLLVAQRRGRAAATLGEIRGRADVVLCWAVDPAERYPRYFERYAPARPERTLLAVSVGADRGPAGAAVSVALTPAQEIAALSVLRAVVLGQAPGDLDEPLSAVAALGTRLLAARYAAIVHDAEPARERERDGHRTEGLIALAQALNGPTRAALNSLRGGGNRSGLESVLTWQTGYPMAVDFSEGAPRYLPASRGGDRLARKAFGAVLVAGTPGPLDAGLLAGTPTVVIGPRASEAPFGPAVAIDTGVAGIHETGTAYRMDEVPLPLTPPLPRPRGGHEVLEALLAAVRQRLGRAG